MLHALLLTFPILFCTGCDTQRAADDRPATAADTCRVAATVRMPDAAYETSGLALSARDPQVLWTHNDRGSDPRLYAVRTDGVLLNETRVAGAEHIDWEDIESAPCGSGTCLYIADIGDNDGSRESITIYEVPEPELTGGAPVQARALHARYPDGAHNAESMFMLPGGDLFVITKGDDGPVSLYRYPNAAGQSGAGVVLERVRVAMAQPQSRLERVTGASASPDGRYVAVRTYGAVHIYAADALVAGSETAPLRIDLRALQEPQGEGVVITNDGTVWLSSEAETNGRPLLVQLTCTVPQ